jgi:hypothetical protein
MIPSRRIANVNTQDPIIIIQVCPAVFCAYPYSSFRDVASLTLCVTGRRTVTGFFPDGDGTRDLYTWSAMLYS